MIPRRAILPVLLLTLGVARPTPLRAAPEDRKFLLVRGRVVDRDGWPIERARIVLRGSRSASAASNGSGRFTLSAPLGALRDLALGSVDVALEARAGTDRLAPADGLGDLRFAIRAIGEPGTEARAEVRASRADVATAVARALAQPGDATAIIELAFAPAVEREVASDHVELTEREEVVLVGVIVPGYRTAARVAPDSAAAAAGKRASEQAVRAKEAREQVAREKEAHERGAREQAARERGAREQAAHERGARERAARQIPPPATLPDPARSTVETRQPEPTRRLEMTSPPAVARGAPDTSRRRPPTSPPQSSPARPAVPDPRRAGTPVARAAPVSPPPPVPTVSPEPCGCRIEGTIEVQSDRPLSRRLSLIVRLRDQPACRDTVELFMGSPRVFEIHGATCGPHLLEVDIPERERFRLANPESERTVPCAHRSIRQVRLILLPR